MTDAERWQTSRGKGGGKGGRSLCPFSPEEMRILYARIPRKDIARMAARKLGKERPPSLTTITNWARKAGVDPIPPESLVRPSECPFHPDELRGLYHDRRLLLREIGELAAERNGRDKPYDATCVLGWMETVGIPRRSGAMSLSIRGIKRVFTKKKNRSQ